MSIVIAVCVLALALAVTYVVSAPLRRAAPPQPGGDLDVAATASRDDLLAAREAKYREIRDAELDYRTGKLSKEDYDSLDADLRKEALDLLDRLEALTQRHA